MFLHDVLGIKKSRDGLSCIKTRSETSSNGPLLAAFASHCTMYFPAGSKLGGDGADDDSVVVIPPLVANHLRALAEALLRNEERRTLNAYVDVRSLSPFRPTNTETVNIVLKRWTCCRQCDNFSPMSCGFFIRNTVLIEVMLV